MWLLSVAKPYLYVSVCIRELHIQILTGTLLTLILLFDRRGGKMTYCIIISCYRMFTFLCVLSVSWFHYSDCWHARDAFVATPGTDMTRHDMTPVSRCLIEQLWLCRHPNTFQAQMQHSEQLIACFICFQQYQIVINNPCVVIPSNALLKVAITSLLNK